MEVSDHFVRFAPWLSTLQRLDPPGRGVTAFPDDFIGPRVLWFACDELSPPRIDDDTLSRICEALSLLALLARADLQAWKKTVLKIWPADWGLKELVEHLAPSDRFVVGLGLNGLTTQTIKGISRFRDYNASAAPPSDEYSNLREDLEAKLSAQGLGDDDHMAIRVTLELDCCDGRPRAAASMLQRTLDLVKAEKELQLSRQADSTEEVQSQRRPLFMITNVDFATTVGVRLGLAGLKVLPQLAQLGIRISHLPPLSLTPTLRQAPEFIQMLRDIACLDDGDDPERTITINDEESPHLLQSLLTTVQHSSKVQVVEINLGNGEELEFPDQSDEWEWVALTIFSKYANHKVDTLELSVENLQQVEVEAVRSVLEAENPFAVTIGRSSLPLPESSPHQITARRLFLEDQNGEALLPFEIRHPAALRVFEPSDPEIHPYWTVLLPGHGIVSVAIDDALSTSEDDLHLENRQVTAIPTFRRIDIMKMAENSMEPVADLLELIGKDTQRIDLYEQVDDTSVDRWCHRVLASCPRLEELLVRHAQVDDLAAFVAAAAQSECRLRELLMSVVPTGSHGENVRALFDTLSDPNHPLAASLRQLNISLYIETESAEAIFEPVLRMLRKNRQLWNVQVTIEFPGPAKALLPEIKAAFDGLSEQVVSIRTAPLGIGSKIAFLSVVDDGGASSLSRLDASILTIVFQFAAHARARHVMVNYGKVHPGDEAEDELNEEHNESD